LSLALKVNAPEPMLGTMLPLRTPMPSPAVTYYTVSDHRFFLGTVALLNSLHLTNNVGEVVVLDVGLTGSERKLLSAHATVFAPPRAVDVHPVMIKTYGHRSLAQASATVVVIDSDVIVTSSLDHVFALARDGQICVYPEQAIRGRWFAEWETTLGLRSPLRPNTYVNAGFVAFSKDHWPNLLKRWREVCELIPPSELWASRSPFQAPDQDALNALLMSEIRREAVTLLPESETTLGGSVTVQDVERLTCSVNGELKTILHYLDSPKPWERSGWLRLASTDYVRLMRRLLFADDVPLQIDPRHVPAWLRPGRSGELTLRTLGAVNRGGIWLAQRVPRPLQDRLRLLRRSASGALAR
jgi:hypothetical protein